MSASSFLAASSRRGEVLRGLDARVGQVEERYVDGQRWARKHYEKAIGGWVAGLPNRAPKEPFAEDLTEIWRAVSRAKCPVTKPVEAAIFDLARVMAKAKRKT